MKIVKTKPTSPGRRFIIKIQNPELHKGKPFEKLITKKNNKAGRNNLGRITVRHKGGGHKKCYRVIDFKRNKNDIKAKVQRIEYQSGVEHYIV